MCIFLIISSIHYYVCRKFQCGSYWCKNSQSLKHISLLHFSLGIVPPSSNTALHQLITTLLYTTLHYTTLHYTTLHYTTLHSTLHYTTLHYATLITRTPFLANNTLQQHSCTPFCSRKNVVHTYCSKPAGVLVGCYYIKLVSTKWNELFST